jgi:hypothetical protein
VIPLRLQTLFSTTGPLSLPDAVPRDRPSTPTQKFFEGFPTESTFDEFNKTHFQAVRCVASVAPKIADRSAARKVVGIFNIAITGYISPKGIL